MDAEVPKALYDLEKFTITSKVISLSAQIAPQYPVVVPINDNILSVESWVVTKWDTFIERLDDFLSGRGYDWPDRRIRVELWLQVNFKNKNSPVKILALYDSIRKGALREDFNQIYAIEDRLKAERERIQSVISGLF